LIDKTTIQEILETARIEEVVGEFVTLKKRGVNLLGLCPFHDEKTPSFTVSPSKGIFKCFGCDKAGNSVKFLMEHEKFSYPEALKYLAKKFNIEITEEEQTPEQIKLLNEKESLFHLNSFAAKFFTKNLLETEEGKAIGLSYFKERGFREDTIKKFQLGYAINKWDHFTKHALSQGYNLEHLKQTGLSVVTESSTFDRFKGRVLFPISNVSGRILGFGGRTLETGKKVAKYVNSPESEIYHKSLVLYGIDVAKNSIISNDNCFLVEGYTDVISLHQAGVENVVASSGTALTPGQIKLVRRYTSNITILYDGDAAGIKASFRGIDLILEQGMQVKIVLFPDGEDPDSFARNHRSSEVQQFITNTASNFIYFKTNLLLKDAGGDPVKKAALIKEIVGSIALIPDQIIRGVYVKECAASMEMDEITLINELNRVRRNNYNKKLKERSGQEAQTVIQPVLPGIESKVDFDYLSSAPIEKDIIRLLMAYGNQEILFSDDDSKSEEVGWDIASWIVKNIQMDDLSFGSDLHQKIFSVVSHELDVDHIPEPQFYLNHSDIEIAELAAGMLATKYELNDWGRVKVRVVKEEDRLKIAVVQSVFSLKLREIEKLFEKNLRKMKTAPADEIEPLLVAQRNLMKKKNLLSAELDRIVLR